MTTWFDHVWNAVDSGCARECCAMFMLRRNLSMLRHLPRDSRVLVGPADLFAAHVPDYVIRDLMLLMARHTHLRFRILTRSADRMEQWFGCYAASELQGWVEEMRVGWPIPHVELGVMVRDQDSADDCIGALVATPASSRFVVIDRLRGDVDLECMTCPAGVYSREQARSCGICSGIEPPICRDGNYNALREGIDEVILAAPFVGPADSHESLWRGSIIDQCRNNNVSIIRPRLPTP